MRGYVGRSFLSQGALLTAVAVLSACGGGGPSAKQAAGEYPADRSLSPEEVVRAYVTALNERDGKRFCALVAPYISGQLDLAGRDPDSHLTRSSSCPQIVSAFIGYIEDCCPPKFERAEIDQIADAVEQGGLTRLDLALTINVTRDDRPATMQLKDRVWLTRVEGAWRVAKLSAVARAASLGFSGDDQDVLAAPDVGAEQRRFQADVVAFERRQREREASFEPTGEAVSCSGALLVGDPANDLVDYRFPAPKNPIPRTPKADLRSVQLVSRGGRVCIRYETAGEIEGPMTFTFNLRDSAAGSRFIQLFHVNLRANGTAQVTSGEDADDHPISVPARVGVTGRRLTLRLDRASFARGKPSPTSRGRPPLRRFAFMAQVQTPLSERRVLNDDLGDSRPAFSYSYPEGRRCMLEC